MECKFTPLILSEILVVKMQMLAVHTVGLTCLLNIIIQTFYALFNSLSLGGKLHEFLFPDIHLFSSCRRYKETILYIFST